MVNTIKLRVANYLSIALACAVLAACATTQKSSSGSGSQGAAPISDASYPTQSGASATKSSEVEPPVVGKPDASSTDGTSLPAVSGAGPSAEEAQLKRQLAEQEAQINKLRTGQEPAAQVEQQSASERSPQSPDAGQSVGAGAIQEPAQVRPAGTAGGTGSTKRDDAIALFPAGDKGESAPDGQPGAAGEVIRSIYFGYDESVIPAKYDAMLLENAVYLKDHPAIKFEIQGNCDERGSREYNLALGARRAQSVKRALELAGAEGGRIQTVSFGSEKPVATGKDEESYSKNRRVDIVY
jgi:peptidoglycan-associated lipoprotein